MKSWTEDNFLERLVPQLRRESGAQIESCPDSESLSAFTEDKASPILRDAIAAHLTRCPKCQEIYERLGQFGKATIPAQDAEWVNAEKRLDNWMGGFLLARTAESPKPTAEPARALRWRDVAKAAFSWKLEWAVGAIAFAALAVAGLLVAKREWLASTPLHVATRQATPKIENSAPVPTARTPDAGTAATKPAEPTLKPAPGTRKNAAPTVSQKSAESLGKVQPETEPHPFSNSPTGESPSQIAQADTPPDLSQNDRIPAGAKATPAAPSRPVHMGHAAGRAPGSTQSLPANAGASLSTPTDHPALLRLEAGTRLWIHIVSINRQPDGSFTFRGSLFQPVSHAGGVLLDQGAELTGSGSVKEGKVTVFIQRFLIQGVPYAVQGATGTRSEQMPGAGSALEFHEGQFLEMWLSSTTVYEKVAAAGSLDQPKP
jgi:hypothetical protein